MRLGEMLEKCDARLDPTATGDFSRTTMLQLIFIVTGMKPTLKMSHLRITHYSGLYERMQQATARRMLRLQETLDLLVEELTSEKIEKISGMLLWDNEWLEKKQKKAPVSPGQQLTLHDCPAAIFTNPRQRASSEARQ